MYSVNVDLRENLAVFLIIPTKNVSIYTFPLSLLISARNNVTDIMNHMFFQMCVHVKKFLEILYCIVSTSTDVFSRSLHLLDVP